MIIATQECISITESFPNIEIKLAYLKGSLNMADSLTKFNQDPIKIINSENFRQGPNILTEGDFESKIKIFYEVKEKNFKYTPFLNEEKDLLTIQQELDDIFDDKTMTKTVKIAHLSTNFKNNCLPRLNIKFIQQYPIFFQRNSDQSPITRKSQIIFHSNWFLEDLNSC